MRTYRKTKTKTPFGIMWVTFIEGFYFHFFYYKSLHVFVFLKKWSSGCVIFTISESPSFFTMVYLIPRCGLLLLVTFTIDVPVYKGSKDQSVGLRGWYLVKNSTLPNPPRPSPSPPSLLKDEFIIVLFADTPIKIERSSFEVRVPSDRL